MTSIQQGAYTEGYRDGFKDAADLYAPALKTLRRLAGALVAAERFDTPRDALINYGLNDDLVAQVMQVGAK